MTYDSKAVSDIELRDCRFNLRAQLIAQGWEFLKSERGVSYFRRPL